jgi:hypothetical protein
MTKFFWLVHLLAPDMSKCAVKRGKADTPGSKLTAQQWGPRYFFILDIKNIRYFQNQDSNLTSLSP